MKVKKYVDTTPDLFAWAETNTVTETKDPPPLFEKIDFINGPQDPVFIQKTVIGDIPVFEKNKAKALCATPICFNLDKHEIDFPLSLAFFKAGKNMPARIIIIAITMRSSTIVNILHGRYVWNCFFMLSASYLLSLIYWPHFYL